MALTQISTAGVKDDAVTSGKIPADAIGSSEIAANAVGSSELADNAVDETAIANGAVTSNKLATNAVDNSKIGPQAVTLSRIINGTSSEDGKFLRANNGASPSFETVSIPAGTTINGNADHRIVTATGTANTIQGESSFTHNPSTYDTTIIHNANAPSDLIIQNDSSGTAANARLTIQSGSNANAGAMLQFVTGSDNWSLLTPKNAGALDFNDNGTLAFKMAGNGNFDVITGDVTINGSGKGIDFAQGANTGTAANILDDYEEGSWTPAYSRPNMTLGLANQFGRYVKVGKVVHIVGKLNTTSESGSSSGGPIIVTGLPFTVRETRTALSVRPSGWSNDHPSFATFELNQTHFELVEEVEGNPSGSTDLTGSRFAGGTGNYLWFGGTYFTDT